MSLRGPNVRSLDSRHLAWPHLLRDPDPATTTADCSTRWSYRQWGFQGQRHWADEQLQLARGQCRQQPRPTAAGPHEPSGAFASVGRATTADPESPRICMFLSFNSTFLLLCFRYLSSALRADLFDRSSTQPSSLFRKLGSVHSDPHQLEDQMQLSIQNSYDRAGNVIRNADAEIARTRAILASIDDLENELAKIGHIREIVKTYRGRIEGLDQRLDQAARRRR